MTQTMFVRPKTGMLVRYENPTLGHIPAEGADVENSGYYRRRIKDGDLTGSGPRKPKKGSG